MLRRTLSAAWIALVALLLLTAAALLVVRLWIPSLSSYRHQVEQVVSDILSRKVTIERLEATWRGFSPVLKFRQLHIAGDRDKRTGLAVREVWVSFDIKRYLAGREIQLNGINVVGTDLTLVRATDGSLFVRELQDQAAGSYSISGFPNIDGLSIHDSTITIVDLQSGIPPQRFTDVTLSLKNQADSHRVTGYAMLPPELGYRIDVDAELFGMPARFSDWQGRVYLKGQSLSLSSALTYPLPEEIDLQGIADARLWLDIEAAQVREVRTELDLHDFRMTHRAGSASYEFNADKLIGQFGWQGAGHGWRFAAQRVVVEQEESVWQTAAFALSGATQEDTVYLAGTAPEISLDGLGPLLLALPVLTADQKQQLAGVHPQGLIENLYFSVEKTATSADISALEATFTDLSLRESREYPFVTGLDGSVSGASRAGIITLDTHAATFHNDRLFRDALMIDTVRGEVRWRKTTEQTEITADELVVVNPDMQLTAALGMDIPHSGGSPAVDLHVDIAHANLGRVHDYLPAHIMSPRAVAWLDRSLVSGAINNASILLQGRLDQIPFDHGEGRLEVRLPVTDAVLAYHPGWSPITGLDAQVNFSGRSMDIASRKGAIRTARLRTVQAQIKDLKQPELLLQGTVEGAMPVMLAELGSSPLGSTYGGFVDRTSTTGTAGLELDLVIPLTGNKPSVEVRGNITLSENALQVKDTDIALTNIQGVLAFAPDGVTGENLTARLFDRPVTVRVWKDTVVDRTRIGIDGPLGLLNKLAGDSKAVQSVISGSTDWRVLLGIGAVQARREVPSLDLEISSSLRGVAIDLPGAYAKPADSVRQLTVRVEGVERQNKQLRFSYGDQLRGLLEVTSAASGFTVRKGMVTLDNTAPAMPDTNRLAIRGHLDKLQLSDWTNRFAGGGKNGLPVDVDVSVGELDVLHYILRNVTVRAQAAGPVWTIRSGGDSIAGDILLTRGKSGAEKIVVDLERLILESAERPKGAQAGTKISPAEFPALQVTVGQLVYDKTDFGSLDIVAQRSSANVVTVDKLTLSSDLLSLNIQGDWKSGDGQQISSFHAKVDDGNLEKLLEFFDFEPAIECDELSGSMHATWPGPPWAFSLPSLEGNLKLKIVDGQLLDLEPGAAGRMIGLLSLTSLQRRLSLDFSDLFGEGFSFDDIRGNFIFESGNAYTNDLTITGPAAKIDVSGRTGLTGRDYDQLVTVTPQMQSGLALAGTLAGGPAVGAALLIADKLLEGNLGALSRLNRRQYTVTGLWSDPVVTRIDAPEPDVPANTDPDTDEYE